MNCTQCNTQNSFIDGISGAADGCFMSYPFMGLINSSHAVNVQAMRGSYKPLDDDLSMTGSVVDIELRVHELLGKGHFSNVYRAILKGDNNAMTTVALKKTVFNPNVKDREVAILRSMRHVNIIRLLYFYWTKGDRPKDPTELNMVLEYLPMTVHHHQEEAARKNMSLPLIEIKLWCYQLFKAMKYMHAQNICHRDIKPHNLLVKRECAILKVGDFGSAKQLDPHNNVPYIVSRWYRAPELILQNKRYKNSIDMWACGCVLGELFKNKVLFPAEKNGPHILMMMRALGTPNTKQIEEMHPKEPFHPPKGFTMKPWRGVLPSFVPLNGSELLDGLLQWSPDDRLTAHEAMAHALFDDIRDNRHMKLPNGNEVDSIVFED